jgi:hypothetical protein
MRRNRREFETTNVGVVHGGRNICRILKAGSLNVASLAERLSFDRTHSRSCKSKMPAYASYSKSSE